MLLSGLLSALQTLAMSRVLLFDSIPSPVFPGPLVHQRHGKRALVSDCVLGTVQSQSACKRLLDGRASLSIRLFNVKQPPVFTNKNAGTQEIPGLLLSTGWLSTARSASSASNAHVCHHPVGLLSLALITSSPAPVRASPHPVSLSLWLLPFPDPHILYPTGLYTSAVVECTK